MCSVIISITLIWFSFNKKSGKMGEIIKFFPLLFVIVIPKIKFMGLSSQFNKFNIFITLLCLINLFFLFNFLIVL